MSEYITAHIDGGGYINFDDGIIHRETRKLGQRCVSFSSIRAAKKLLPEKNCPLVVELADHGGASKLFCFPKDEEEVKERLKVWKGCYGAWPVHKMKEVADV